MIFDHDKDICHWIEEQVKKCPKKVAVSMNGADTAFEDFNYMADRIALSLIDNKMEQGDIIAVDVSSGVKFAAAVLGVLKAGGTYTYLPQVFGGEYAGPVLEQCKAKLMICENRNQQAKTEFGGKKIYMDELSGIRNEIMGRYMTVTEVESYMTTFGSQSERKLAGIKVSRRKIQEWIDFNITRLKVDFSDTLFVTVPGLTEGFPLWMANLATGGRVCFYDMSDNASVLDLTSYMESNGFTSVILPLCLLEKIISGGLYVKCFSAKLSNIVTFGEEEFEAGEFKEFIKLGNIRWHNYFGFPEIQMVTSLAEGNCRGESLCKHTGRPVANTGAFILNASGQLAPFGVYGELYFHGDGCMDGYWMEENSSKYFIEIPSVTDKRLYKTGYMASRTEDGKVSVTGRVDDRILINGFRVYPYEIETALLKNSMVSDCAVFKGGEDKIYCRAYVVPNRECPVQEIENYLIGQMGIGEFQIGIIPTGNIPRTEEGVADEKYLEKKKMLDSLDAVRLENELISIDGIENAAIVLGEELSKNPNIHLKDCLPAVRKTRAVKTEDNSPAGEESSDGTQLAIVHGGDFIHDPGDPKILQELLARAGSEYKDEEMVCIRADGSAGSLTYGQLLEEAQRILTGLRKSGLLPGDKVIFQFEKNEDYICAFWGCTLGGFVPVPMTVPKIYTGLNSETVTIRNVWEMLDKPMIFGNQMICRSVQRLFEDVSVLSIEDMRKNEPDSNWHQSMPEDMAIILFTSGSTGKPKGVVQCHRSILAREKGAIEFSGFSRQDIFVNWFPMEHVVGIFMFHILQVYLGSRQIHIKSDYILSNPLRWMDILHKYRATVTWAPNFAFSLVSEHMTDSKNMDWDLSSVRRVINAGETVNAESCIRFLRALAPFGLSSSVMKPEWGMSETCSVVLVSDDFSMEGEEGYRILDKNSLNGVIRPTTKDDPDSVSFVNIGKPYMGTSFRITDANHKVLKEGMVGRLQIKGVTVTSGYYKNPEINREVFTQDGWFDTGDLAFIKNGIVTFTGRLKDVIIINGINYNNNEIEAIVEQVENVEVSYAVACAVREQGSDTDKVAVFYNSALCETEALVKQIREIRRAVMEKTGVGIDYIIPVEKEDIPKTNIGKIQRSKIGKLFETGHFDEIVRKIDIAFENERTLPSWFFEKVWQKSEVSGRHLNGNTNETCLIFDDGMGLAEYLAKELSIKGVRCIRVLQGDCFSKTGQNMYTIAVGAKKDYELLFEEFIQEGISIDTVFHMFLYGWDYQGPLCKEAFQEAQKFGLYSLLNYIQASKGNKNTSRLFVLGSRGILNHENNKGQLGLSALSGFSKCISLEFPGVHCTYIDLERVAHELNTEYIIDEWKNVGKPVEVVYKSGSRWLSRLKKIDPEPQTLSGIPLREHGIYLVIGGLGGVGKHVSKMLLESYKARLVFIGRTELPERDTWNDCSNRATVNAVKYISVLKDYESSGGEFLYFSGDISTEGLVEHVISSAEKHWGDAVSGVFHLAGHMEDMGNYWQASDSKWIASETIDSYENAFNAKAYGTINILNALQKRPEAVLVAFSSVMSYFGSMKFSAYAAANAFLDAVCLDAAKMNQNVYCFNWSMWDNTGMSENTPVQMKNAILTNGFSMISPEQGLNSLLVSLRFNKPQVFIGLDNSNKNMRVFLNRYPSDKQKVKLFYSVKNDMEYEKGALFDFIARNFDSNRFSVVPQKVDEFPLIKGKTDYSKLSSMVKTDGGFSAEFELPVSDTEEGLLNIWKEILGRSRIGINDSFFDQGGNSLKIIQLCNRINEKYGVNFAVQDLFKFPTIRGMADAMKKEEPEESQVKVFSFE